MSVTDNTTDAQLDDLGGEPTLTIEFALHEAEAVRTWLLKPAADGTTSLDDPSVNGALARLGRAVDAALATVNVRRELEQAGLDVAHLSDEQVRELGRRVSEAAVPVVRG